MKKYIALGLAFLVVILFTKYHYIFKLSTVPILIWAIVFGFYSTLAVLALWLNIVNKRIPNYIVFSIHIVVGFILAIASSYFVSTVKGNYAVGYVFLGLHIFISPFYFILCVILLPKPRT